MLMKQHLQMLKEIKRNKAIGYWGSRIISQIEYASELSEVRGNEFDELLDEATKFLYDEVEREGVITQSACKKTENMLMPLSEEAKKFNMICAGHAHIDMNWMWGWNETVMVALDTFRTVLDLMDEYPDFTFSQS